MSNPEIFNFADAKKTTKRAVWGGAACRDSTTPPHPRGIKGKLPDIWYLVRMIGPGSTWLRQVADLFETKPNMPGCSFISMGVPRGGFPRARFGDALGFVQADNELLHQDTEGA